MTKDYLDIVYIDDDPDTLRLFKATFRTDTSVMMHYYMSPNGALDALHKMNYTDVDAIILDLAMPQMSGRQLTEELRSNESIRGREKLIPIFWYTGWAYSPDSPIGRTELECSVTKVYHKGTYQPLDVVADVKRILKGES